MNSIRYFVCDGHDTLVASAATWKLVNPLLVKGDFAVSSDTKEIKQGDGHSYWTSLPKVIEVS